MPPGPGAISKTGRVKAFRGLVQERKHMPYITCRCGKKFSLQYGDMAAICPDCGRTYYNEPGYHPQTVEEQDWKCSVCGKMNPRYVHGLLCVKCLY